MSNPEAFQRPTPESEATTSEAQLKLEKLLKQIDNFVNKEEFDLAKDLLEENKETVIQQLRTLLRAEKKGEVEKLGNEVKRIAQVIREGLASPKLASTKQGTKTDTILMADSMKRSEVEEVAPIKRAEKENIADKQPLVQETQLAIEKSPESLDESLEMMKDISKQIVARTKNDINEKKYARAIEGFRMLFNEFLKKDQGATSKEKISSLINKPFFREFIEKVFQNMIEVSTYPPYTLYGFMENLLEWELNETASVVMDTYLTQEKIMRSKMKGSHILPETSLSNVAKLLATSECPPFKGIYDKFKTNGLEPVQEKTSLQETKTATDSVAEENKEEIKFKDNKLARVLSELRNEIKKVSYASKDSDNEILKKISDTISSDEFSIDDAPLRSLINWGIVFYKTKDESKEIWDLYVKKMSELGIFVIQKTGGQYNEIDHASTEGPIRDAIVTEVIQPGFKTSATYEGKYPKVLEIAIVITKPRP